MKGAPLTQPRLPGGRWLLFSDIHANRRAAHDIAGLAGDFDRLVFAGDICGYGQNWAYVIDLFIDLKVAAVLGNHDHLVLDESIELRHYPSRVAHPIEQARADLDGRYRDYLGSLPWEIDFEEGLFVRHTTGVDTYCRSAEQCEPLIDSTEAGVIVFGHTHEPCDWQHRGRRLVNPGSMSHGRRGAARSYATLVDGLIQHHQLPDLS